jgi:hypothetical protein
VAQARNGIVRRELARADLIEKLADGFRVHVALSIFNRPSAGRGLD